MKAHRLISGALLIVSGLGLFIFGTDDIFETPSNTIRWVTQSEKDNFGYDVYRARSKEGPFAKINEVTIAGAGTSDMPSYYQFIDRSIESNTVYWYYVESVSLEGDRKQATPVYASRPKSLLGEWFDH